METFSKNSDRFEDIIYGYEYNEVEEITIDQRRWVNVVETIYKHNPTGNYYAMTYEVDKTEMGDSASDEVTWEQVYPVDVVKTIYVTKDKL